MSVSSGSDVTIPIQDSPPPPPSPYANRNGEGNMSKTPEPRGDVIVNTGIVNEAYQMESKDEKDSKDSHNTQITMNGSGDAQPPLNEALNSELINLNILNTIPDKPQPEFGPYDNFDEYFIPVNQHKKFLRRSEKLYVTKDKRKQSQWKKYICWIIGAFILAAIVTVAVLAGVGLIPQKSANSFVTDSVVGTTPLMNSPSSTTMENRLTPALSTSTSTEYITTSTTTTSAPILPQDDTYVPNTADVEFHMTDLQYEAALNDKTSNRFRELASEIEQEMKYVLRRDAGLESTFARAMHFSPGSVHAKMRIGWVDDKKDLNEIKMALSKLTTFGSHTIMALSSFGVVNHCKFANNGCSNYCTFDYESLEFLCTCPELMLLGSDKKTCNNITTPESSPETEAETGSETETTAAETAETDPHPTDAPEPASVSQQDEDTVPVEITPETIQASSAAPEVEHEHEHEVSSSVPPQSESYPVVSSETPVHEHNSPVEEHSPSPVSEEPISSEESVVPEEQKPSPSSEPENESVVGIPIGAVTTTEKSTEGETNAEEENTNPTNPSDIGDNSEIVHNTEPESQPPTTHEEPHETPVETTVTPAEETKSPEIEEAGQTNAAEETEAEATITPVEILDIISTSTTTTSTTETPTVVESDVEQATIPPNSNLERETPSDSEIHPLTTTSTTVAPEVAAASHEGEQDSASVESGSGSQEGETTIHPEGTQDQSRSETEEEAPQGRRSKAARHETFAEGISQEDEIAAETEKSVSPASAIPSTSSEFMVFSDNGNAHGSNSESSGTTDSSQNDSIENASGSVENTGSASVESNHKEDLVSAAPEIEITTTPQPSLVNDTMINEQTEPVTENASNIETLIAENPSPAPMLEKIVEEVTARDMQDEQEQPIEETNTQPPSDSVLTTTSTTPAPSVLSDLEQVSSDEVSAVKAPEPVAEESSSTEIPLSDSLFAVTTTLPSATTNSSQPLSTTIKIITPQTQSFGNEYETENSESESASEESNHSRQENEPTGLENDL